MIVEQYWVTRDTDEDIIVIWLYKARPVWEIIFDENKPVGFWTSSVTDAIHEEMEYPVWAEQYGLDIEPGECKLMVASYKWYEGEHDEQA
jgi:hypothetical protein